MPVRTPLGQRTVRAAPSFEEAGYTLFRPAPARIIAAYPVRSHRSRGLLMGHSPEIEQTDREQV